MRIALITPYDVACFGGVSEHVAALQHELQSRGHEAFVVAPRPAETGSGTPAPFAGFGRTVSIRTNGSRARITLDPTCYPGLKAFVRRERFDVVHVHELLTPVLPALALFASDAATIGTFHSFRDAPPRYSAPVRPLLAYLLRRLDGRVAVSEAARQYIGRFGAGPCELIPNGVDLDRFGGRAEPFPWAREGRPTILFVGRFDEPRKGLSSLLRAFPLVRDRFPETRLVVVGDGAQKRFRRLLGRLPTEAVAFAGAVGREDLARYYASCDVFCAPSLGGESFGICSSKRWPPASRSSPLISLDTPASSPTAAKGGWSSRSARRNSPSSWSICSPTRPSGTARDVMDAPRPPPTPGQRSRIGC